MKTGGNAAAHKGKRVCKQKKTGPHPEQHRVISEHTVEGGTMSRDKTPVEGGGQEHQAACMSS